MNFCCIKYYYFTQGIVLLKYKTLVNNNDGIVSTWEFALPPCWISWNRYEKHDIWMTSSNMTVLTNFLMNRAFTSKEKGTKHKNLPFKKTARKV
jgi:hypothetical protein